jgi:Na+-translocating ferredoxin:NAD+ oxidoreductase RnfG subunit
VAYLSREMETRFNIFKNIIGYIFYAVGKGYSGKTTILIGIENKETIKSINIIYHNERRKVNEEYASILDLTSFIKQFNQLNVDSCFLKESEGKVDSISGATHSSQAIVDIVREAVLEKAQYIN